MEKQPNLLTARLKLRPFTLGDASRVQLLAGEREIAENTLSIPYPYENGMAEEWIGSHEARFRRRESVAYAVERRDDALLIGAIGLEVSIEHERAELGYWIGKPYWNEGYCTEAAGAVLAFGFNEWGLSRIHAAHFGRNPASGRVLQKLGMKHEGTLRQHIKKWDRFVDLEVYGLLKDQFARSAEGK